MAYSNVATGNVAPVITIGYGDKGVSEGIVSPTALAFDSAGNLYVLNGESNLLVFTPPFSDTESPVAVWTTGLGVQFLMTSDGENIYAGDNETCLVYDGGLDSGGIISRSFAYVVGKHGTGAYDLKATARGSLYFPMVAPPKRKDNNAIGILPPGATSAKHAKLLFNVNGGNTMDNLAISN